MLGKGEKTTDDSERQERSKSAKNQEVTSTQADGSIASKKVAKVPTDDRSSTKKVTCSDKLNNKLSNKPAKHDTDLALVLEAWPELPEAIRSAIVAVVRSSQEK